LKEQLLQIRVCVACFSVET